MESTVTTSVNSYSWEIAPANTLAAIVLGVLFLYLFFLHAFLVLMVMDIVLGWMRKFSWFPKEGKRRKALVNWAVAVGLFFGFLAVAGSAGWLEFIPR